MAETYDFSGWATKNDLLCSDGRIIRKDAFKDQDGVTVPLVWQHFHDEPSNVLGHALLKNEAEGVRAYGSFNDTELAQEAKEAVRHRDITCLSIFANKLKQDGGNVLHGAIREVSLVLAGANPGAYIDFPILEHSDGSTEESQDEALIYTGEYLAFDEEDASVEHEDKEESEMADEKNKVEDENQSKERTVEDVLNTMTEEQKKVVDYLVGEALAEEPPKDEEAAEEPKEASDDEAAHEDQNGGESMKHNAFEGEEKARDKNVLTHAEEMTIIKDGKKYGSLKESALAHADDYGIQNINLLFPDDQFAGDVPNLVTRDMEWVGKVMNGCHKTPFSRIKSLMANITADDARAKGYLKKNLKKEEFFPMIKRSTDPQTIYKKQKLDRDDMVDITGFDVVGFLHKEMRMMLDEEIARAILVGDGRSDVSDDKIFEDHIRSIYHDSDVYSVKVDVAVENGATDADKAREFIREAIKARKLYKGSGNPVAFMTEDMLTECLLLEDGINRYLYPTVDILKTTLRVSDIITVPVMEDLTDATHGDLAAIIVNLADYNIGADKGGAVNTFEDFDIDYNQNKYLIETRCSGALVKPYSALVISIKEAA